MPHFATDCSPHVPEQKSADAILKEIHDMAEITDETTNDNDLSELFCVSWL